MHIGAVLISGDLELDDIHTFSTFLREWTNKGVKVFTVFGEHDTKSIRIKLEKIAEELTGFYILENHNVVELESLNFYVQGLSCKPNQKDFERDLDKVVPYSSNKPGVFLTHPYNLSIQKMREIGCKYYAVGHIHYSQIDSYGEIFRGRPGHLYSLWDGNGKAWPARAIVGEFIANELLLSLIEFPSPQTVRLYTDPHRVERNKIPLVIENCSLIEADILSKMISGKWEDQIFRGVYRGFYDKENEDLEILVRKILEVFSCAIFVTPSDSKKMKKKYGYSRGVFKAKTLLSNQLLFDEFIDRIPKATNKTQ